MSDKAKYEAGDVGWMIEAYRARINESTGAERAWAYTSWSLLKEGYYSPDELIDLSLQHGFTLDTPVAKIKRGTRIGRDVVVKNGTVIDGESVSVGAGTILDGAQISGSNVVIGQDNSVSGTVLLDHLVLGSGNRIRDLAGDNEGQVAIGNHNVVDGVSIHNPGRQVVQIGNHNELHRGLSINCLFPCGRIRIGHYNSLGRDGGGVISTAYRFNKRWWGDVFIGSHVETTRGAEILGFSLLGWPLSAADEEKARNLFVNGPLTEVIRFFEKLWDQDLEARSGDNTISLFGVVKVKMSCLSGTVKVKDDTRIQSSFLRDIIIQERSKIYFAAISHTLSTPLRVNLQDRAIEHLTITGPLDWSGLPTEPQTDGYRKEDADFYQARECEQTG